MSKYSFDSLPNRWLTSQAFGVALLLEYLGTVLMVG
jgi:hypothetical protein